MSSRQLDSVIASNPSEMDSSIVSRSSYRVSESLGSSNRSVIEEDLEEARRRLLAEQDSDEEDKEGQPAVVGRGLPFVPEVPQPMVTQTTQYGSVTTLQSNQQRKLTRGKRYRLPLLILLAFDWGLVVFLSIICTQNFGGGNKGKSDYFRFDIQQGFFDLVVIATVRTIVNALFYLLVGWVTRLVMAFTTLVSTLYVPIKAYYCWQYISELDTLQQIAALLLLFVSFVMPWFAAFFFEFKYLPAELTRLNIESWRDWRGWVWPRALVRQEREESSLIPETPEVIHNNGVVGGLRPPRRAGYSTSTRSLDFRTPISSSRGSPIAFGERHLDDDLPPITEEINEQAVPECDQTMSSEDLRFKREGAQAFDLLEALTRNNDGWTLQRTEENIQCFSKPGSRRKVWKSDTTIEASAETLWNILYPGDQTQEWSPQCALNETIYRVDDVTDLAYTVSNAIGPVSSRDFVSVRQIGARNGCYYSASMSTVTSMKPEQPGKVRGENGSNGYVLIPLSATRTRFIWVINTDLKGWLPQAVIDQTVSGALVSSCQSLIRYVQSQARTDN